MEAVTSNSRDLDGLSDGHDDQVDSALGNRNCAKGASCHLQKDKIDDMPELTGWGNFYVIVGSSAGALIGLQFVVITLIAEIPLVKDGERASSAFATPTIVHFGAVLILSAIISAPWHTMFGAAVFWGLIGLIGLTYVLIVTRHMRLQTAYSPEFEDRL